MKDSRSHFNNDGMDPDWKPADVKPPSDKHDDKIVDAAIAFAKDHNYLSHPKVRPYMGTENGDDPDRWNRDYVAALCRVILDASRSSVAGSEAQVLRRGEKWSVERDGTVLRDNFSEYAFASYYAQGCNASRSARLAPDVLAVLQETRRKADAMVQYTVGESYATWLSLRNSVDEVLSKYVASTKIEEKP